MGRGFLLGAENGFPIPAANGFGHSGAGGALAVADPDRGLGFAYGTSHLHDQHGPSPRTRALVDALMRSVS